MAVSYTHLDVYKRQEYSSEELTRIALECPEHIYHLEEDACYIEIVDSCLLYTSRCV